MARDLEDLKTDEDYYHIITGKCHISFAFLGLGMWVIKVHYMFVFGTLNVDYLAVRMGTMPSYWVGE